MPTPTAVPSVVELVNRSLDADPGRPRITYYDRRTAERTELSGATLRNWVDKTSNLLRDDLDVSPGQTVAVALPPHWQTAAVLLATWAVGAAVSDRVATNPGGNGQDVVFCSEDRLMELADAPAREVVVTALHPLGRPVAAKPAHVLDYAVEVRAHGDHFAAVHPDDAGPALYAGSLVLTHASLTEATAATAERLGIRADDRVLIAASTIAEAGPLVWLLAPLSVGASVVLVRLDDDPEAAAWLRRVAEQEQVTATLGLDLPAPDGPPDRAPDGTPDRPVRRLGPPPAGR